MNSVTGQSEPLLIFPCNGSGLEALDCLGDRYRCIGFVDDTPEKQGQVAYGLPVFGREALRNRNTRVLAVPGGPESYLARQQLIEGLAIPAERFATVIHPWARVSPLARIGRNVLIMAGVVITSNAVIGDNVCILPNTVVHHDVVIGDWSLIGSNASIAGRVTVGRNCYVGSGTRIRNGRRIGDRALTGLASNIIRDVTEGDSVVGNPGRPLRQADPKSSFISD